MRTPEDTGSIAVVSRSTTVSGLAHPSLVWWIASDGANSPRTLWASIAYERPALAAKTNQGDSPAPTVSSRPRPSGTRARAAGQAATVKLPLLVAVPPGVVTLI